MTAIFFTKYARRNFRKLDPKTRKRVLEKLKWYASQDDPLDFADTIKGETGKVYRYRIGDYRVIFDWDKDGILVTEAGHRRDVYR